MLVNIKVTGGWNIESGQNDPKAGRGCNIDSGQNDPKATQGLSIQCIAHARVQCGSRETYVM